MIKTQRQIIRSPLIGVIMTLSLSCFFESSVAAYCSLRDPTLAIQTLYPESNQYRSIVRPIDKRIRDKVSELLPFTIHYNEIGNHTLYQILIDDVPSGFIQARSERSRWGLIEIAWAIAPDLSIENLIFQRCRNPICNDQLKTQLLAKLKGMRFHDMLQLITADGRDLTDETKNVFPNHVKLHLNVIHSALKTLAVTELVWNDVIHESPIIPTADRLYSN